MFVLEMKGPFKLVFTFSELHFASKELLQTLVSESLTESKLAVIEPVIAICKSLALCLFHFPNLRHRETDDLYSSYLPVSKCYDLKIDHLQLNTGMKVFWNTKALCAWATNPRED